MKALGQINFKLLVVSVFLVGAIAFLERYVPGGDNPLIRTPSSSQIR